MNHFDHTSPNDHHHNHQVQLVVSNDPNVAANADIMDVNNQQQPIHLMVNLPNGNNSSATTVPFDNHHQQQQQQQPNYHQHPDSNTASNEAIDSTTTASYAYYTYDSCGQLTSTTGVGPSATPFQVSWNKVELIQQPSSMATQQSEWYHNQQQQSQMLTTTEQAQQAAILVPGSSMPGSVTTNFVTTAPNFNQQQQQQFVNRDLPNMQPIQIALVPAQSSVQTQLQPQQSVPSSKTTTKKTTKRAANSKQSNRGEGRQSKPVSAYALFFRDTQASIKAENPSASFGEISKIVASKWEILSKEDKIVYKERADMEKKNYLQNLASNKAKEIAQTNQTATPPSQQTSTELPIQMATIPLSGSNQQQMTNSDELTTFESTNTGPSINILVTTDDMLTESSIPVDDYHQTAYGNYNQQQQPQTTIHQTNTYHHHHHHSALNNQIMNNPSTSNVIDSYSHAEPHIHSLQHSSQQHMHHTHQFIHSNDINTNAQHDDKTHHSTPPSSSTFPFTDDDDPTSAVSFFVNSTDAEQNLIDLGIDLNDFDDIHLLNDENIYSPTNSSTTNSLFDTANPVVGVDPFLSSLEQTSSDHHQQQQSSTTNDPILTSTYASDSILQDSYPTEMIYESNGRTSSDIDQHYESANNNFLHDSSSSAMDHVSHNELDSSVIESDTTLMNGENNDSSDHQPNNEQSAVCARDGCQRTTIDSNQWDREFCSEECCVLYCSDVFRTWTSRKQQQMTADMSQHVLASSSSA